MTNKDASSPTEPAPANEHINDTAQQLQSPKSLHIGDLLARSLEGGPNVVYTVEDDQYDPNRESIEGVNLWDTFHEHSPGMLRLRNSTNSQFVFPLTGSGFRPQLGVPIIDCWIIRADVIRHMMSRGKSKRYGIHPSISLTTDELEFAHQLCRWWLRKRTRDLLKRIPPRETELYRTLATVAYSATLTPEILTTAMTELAVLSNTCDLQTLLNSTQHSVTNLSIRPTRLELIDAMDCSEDAFLCLRKKAGIPTQIRGHCYSVDEVDELIKAVQENNGNKQRQWIDALRQFGT